MGMHRLKVTAPLDRTAAADLFRHTLVRIPSVFGRLMYLASLRDPNSGIYRHHGFSTAFGKEQSTQALRLSHGRSFREWLKLTMREKHADLLAYLDTLDDPKGLVVEYWLESEGYLNCVPDSATRIERELFTTDIAKLLDAVNFAGGGSRKSSRRR